jgi:hypothetical protein
VNNTNERGSFSSQWRHALLLSSRPVRLPLDFVEIAFCLSASH